MFVETSKEKKMSNEANLVFKGYIQLLSWDREEVRKKIEEYEKATSAGQKEINEGTRTMVGKIYLGPVGTTCPCCGR